MGRPRKDQSDIFASGNSTGHNPTEPLDNDAALEEIAAQEEKLAALKKNVKWNFQKHAQKIHSLYKLLPARFKRNVSWTSTPDWQEVEHVHFFHSINSSGEKQIECVPIGGHFHEMKVVTPATENEPAVLECSPPLKRVRQKNVDGHWEVVTVLAAPNDNHRHEVEYKHSEIWSPPNINPEFAKLQEQMASKFIKSSEFVEQ